MNNFKKGDVLVGSKRSRDGAYHPIVFIDGSDDVPIAVVLTHSNDFPCNIKLLNSYGDKNSYFIAHLIDKMSEWGPYKKVDELKKEDIDLIETHVSNQTSITWMQYEEYTEGKCPDHD